MTADEYIEYYKAEIEALTEGEREALEIFVTSIEQPLHPDVASTKPSDAVMLLRLIKDWHLSFVYHRE